MPESGNVAGKNPNTHLRLNLVRSKFILYRGIRGGNVGKEHKGDSGDFWLWNLNFYGESLILLVPRTGWSEFWNQSSGDRVCIILVFLRVNRSESVFPVARYVSSGLVYKPLCSCIVPENCNKILARTYTVD